MKEMYIPLSFVSPLPVLHCNLNHEDTVLSNSANINLFIHNSEASAHTSMAYLEPKLFYPGHTKMCQTITVTSDVGARASSLSTRVQLPWAKAAHTHTLTHPNTLPLVSVSPQAPPPRTSMKVLWLSRTSFFSLTQQRSAGYSLVWTGEPPWKGY